MSITVLVSNETDDRVGVERLEQIDGVEVLTYDPNTLDLTAEQRAAHILMPPFRGSHRALPLLNRLPELRMVQLLSAGVDEWSGEVPGHVLLASARGAHGRPISEWVISAILALYRQWPALVRYQDERVWAHRRVDADTLAGKRVLIIGAGAIGTAVAKRVEVFEASATLVARSARDGVHPATALPDLVGAHDIVVIAAPINEDTRGLVNKDFLAAMPDGAMVVNVGRGEIVDTDALTAELQTGRLRATLDVTDPEPLPAEHPLWTCKNAIISPHMSRTVPGTNALCYEVAATQIATFVEGGKPSNMVQRDR
ncbi:phosphoglycerate dehydrogenase [Kibdelosporangium philippinense]|uniref:Phosphoglycerate dehydrogenase n=1 Tax=Kibdelosporangium philippinense TaxID=211113 RepID=A0ABS8ZQY0_9PSEU|nr:NAD(P)-dependent oxidoreductase [Kibdelosporangium philippinense]MCE7009340.1 phosphoglycerate dehydrogenase [Kibdelosporangium philippinense]